MFLIPSFLCSFVPTNSGSFHNPRVHLHLGIPRLGIPGSFTTLLLIFYPGIPRLGTPGSTSSLLASSLRPRSYNSPSLPCNTVPCELYDKCWPMPFPLLADPAALYLLSLSTLLLQLDSCESLPRSCNPPLTLLASLG